MFIKHRDYILRQLVMSDAFSLFKNYKGNKNCAKYITSNPHTNIEQTRKLINNCLSDYQTKSPTSLIYAIVEPKNIEVIGLLVVIFNKNLPKYTMVYQVTLVVVASQPQYVPKE